MSPLINFWKINFNVSAYFEADIACLFDGNDDEDVIAVNVSERFRTKNVELFICESIMFLWIFCQIMHIVA